MTRRIGLAGILAFVVALGGCGVGTQQGPLTASEMENLKLRDVGELYRLHQVQFKKAPRSLKDFNSIGDANARTAYGAIRGGDVIVRWQATLPDTDSEPSSPPSDEILAYWKTVPEKGGPVLTLDRRVRTMTVEEFKAVHLAGTADAGPLKSR
jgi:hypothetical protein